MDKYELAKILSDHSLWVSDRGGSRANLLGADLRGADLLGADLRLANLCGANLVGANLGRSNLREANLHGADLRRVELYGSYLRMADLRWADLSGADLYRADLRGANLYGANLRRTNLYAAKLDSPVYQFQIGQHNAVCTKEYVQIGCKRCHWDYWLANYEEIGSTAGYTEEQIEAYINVIRMFKELLWISKN